MCAEDNVVRTAVVMHAYWDNYFRSEHRAHLPQDLSPSVHDVQLARGVGETGDGVAAAAAGPGKPSRQRCAVGLAKDPPPHDQLTTPYDGLVLRVGVDEGHDFAHEGFGGAQKTPATAVAPRLRHDVVERNLRREFDSWFQ